MLKKLFTITLLLSLATITPAVYAATPANAPTPAPQKKGGEQHPHIRAAIHELEEAKKELQTAAHDFGGHRVEAIEAIDNALKQLRQALEYDKK